jgi:UDP-N-acetylglucosamine acyltransferase
MAIDPTARVADGARLGEGVEIGPYCLVGQDVELGNRVRLVANVCIAGVTSIGEGTVVYPFASLGTPPQSVHYRGAATRLTIGPRCEVRESVTMNTGTEEGGGITRVGERCLFMVGSHVAHDCQVGDDVTFANNVVLGGHVTIGDNAFLGGLAAVHQFNRVGEGAMIGGLTPVRADVIPFGLAFGQGLIGLNVVGLRRRGLKRPDLLRLRRAYRALFTGAGAFVDRLEAVAHDFADDPLVEKIVAFIRAGGKRSLMQPLDRRKLDENGDDGGDES